ncbi:MAG: hypothetical protein CMJ69_06660 [Planctomycetaceae bacterium]|nr:hypothetical protein [Planctomycetaceae bacterium]
MKASTFAIAVGATVSAIAPIGVVNPSGYVTALADLLGQSSLVHTIAVALLAMGTLVLLQPVAGQSLKLRLVRAVAWLAVIKSLLMLWAPALVESVTDWMTTLPAWPIRLGSVVDLAFGLLMLWVGRRLIGAESYEGNDLATSDARTADHA